MNQDLINQGVIITALGESLIENAAISGVSLKLKQFSIGDGGSDNFNPTYETLKALTAIPGEWDKRNLIDVYNNPDGVGYIAEGLVPHNVGEGKYCRIAGYWTIDNKLFAVHLIPAWQKPTNSGNLLIELPLKAYFVVSDKVQIALKIDPSLVTATREYVDLKFSNVDVDINKSASTKYGALHIFTSHADLQIPADTGTAFKFMVDESVDLNTGKCRLLAPEGGKILVKKVLSDIANIKKSGVIYTAIKVNGIWKIWL